MSSKLIIRIRKIALREENVLVAQGNIASTYSLLGRYDEALRLRRDVYFGWVKLHGEQHAESIREANNYGTGLMSHGRFKEVKALVGKMMPVARRVLGENDQITLTMRWFEAGALYRDVGATLDDLREAVEKLEDVARTTRRVLGGAHPIVGSIERDLQDAQAALRAREASPGEPVIPTS